MNIKTRTATPLASRLLAVLAALALALFALGMAAPAAWADTQILKVTSYEGVYDGQPHSASVSIEGDMEGYSVEYMNAQGEELSGAPSLTDVTYGEYTVSLYTLDGQLIDRADFHISIEPRNVTVNVVGATWTTQVYDGKKHKVGGWYATAAVEEVQKQTTPEFDPYDKVKLAGDAKAEAKGTDAGTYYMGLTDEDFTCDDNNFNVTYNVTDGYLTIQPLPVKVGITGDKRTEVYDGTEHELSSWSMDYAVALEGVEPGDGGETFLEIFDTSNVENEGGIVTATEVGEYPMGLTPELFYCTDSNFTCEFDVTDGMLTIVAADEEDGDDKGGKSKKDDADEESGKPSGTPKTADAADLALPVALMAGAAAAAMAARSRRRVQE